jgi:acyl-CoA synthetase (AMP-forming)/AMP-acid ligase II
MAEPSTVREPVCTPDWWADRDPSRPAVVVPGGETLTYGELAAKSRWLERDWISKGISPGDRVAVVMENRTDYVVVAIAALRCGVRLVAVNVHLTRAEAVHVIYDSDARLIVASERFADLVAEAAGASPAVEAVQIVGEVRDGYEGLYGGAESDSAPVIRPSADNAVRQGAFMFYSSGTTGKPKGILREMPDVSFEQGDPLTANFPLTWGFDQDLVWLNSAPLYHAYPLQTCTSVVRWGGTLVLTEKFDAEESLRIVEEFGVTHTSMVPTMFVRFLRLPEDVRRRYDVSSIRLAIHAGAACPVPVKRAMMEWWGPVLYEFYGGSENIGMVLITPDEWLAHPGSVGRPAPGTISVLGEDHAPVAPYERGTIWFDHAPNFSYHHSPEKTEGVFDADGRATLGDLGYLDEGGYLYLDGRRTDLIISGGVNIYPAEIESRLVEHPAVLDVAVIGVPDEEYGQRVEAFVQLDSGVAGDAELERELLEFCRKELASFKCPRSVTFEESLPRTPAGKLLKRVLMERVWT